MKWLKEEDVIGVPRWLYVSFWVAAGVAIATSALPALAVFLGW